jgi:hypothetical protein
VNYIANLSRFRGDPEILSTGPGSLTGSDRVARCLGWFSIVLGAVELLRPRAVAQFLGMERHKGVLRAYGAREICAGVVSLSTEQQTGLWSRVLGDSMDLAMLLGAYRSDNPKRTNVGLAIGIVIGITMLDIAVAQMTAGVHRRKPNGRRSYADRSGFPRGIANARGAATAGV